MSATTLLLILAGVWFLGFVVIFSLHIVFLQMVTLELAIWRSVLWPIWLATGWPHGTSMRMD